MIVLPVFFGIYQFFPDKRLACSAWIGKLNWNKDCREDRCETWNQNCPDIIPNCHHDHRYPPPELQKRG